MRNHELEWQYARRDAEVIAEERRRRRRVISAGRLLGGGYDPGHIRAAIEQARRVLGAA